MPVLADTAAPLHQGPSVEIPVSLLLRLHNGLAANHPIRSEVQRFIVAIGEKQEKAHWTRAVAIGEMGDLLFDESAYSVACWRGKQETRAKSVAEKVEEIRFALAVLEESEALEGKAQRAFCDGSARNFLLPQFPYSDELAALKTNVRQLLGVCSQLAPASPSATPEPASPSERDGQHQQPSN